MEKEVVGDVSRRYPQSEWAKQDPQRQMLGTGRFSYIKEGYDKHGNTIDMGITVNGKVKVASLEGEQSGRFHAQSQPVLLYRHMKTIMENPTLYKRLAKKIADNVRGLTDEQIKAYVQKTSASIPPLSENELNEAILMLKKIRDDNPPEEKK